MICQTQGCGRGDLEERYIASGCGHIVCIDCVASLEGEVAQANETTNCPALGCPQMLLFFLIEPDNGPRGEKISMLPGDVVQRGRKNIERGHPRFRTNYRGKGKNLFSQANLDALSHRQQEAVERARVDAVRVYQENRGASKKGLLDKIHTLQQDLASSKSLLFNRLDFINVLICKENEEAEGEQCFEVGFDPAHGVVSLPGGHYQAEEVIRTKVGVKDFGVTLGGLQKNLVVLLYGQSKAGKSTTVRSLVTGSIPRDLLKEFKYKEPLFVSALQIWKDHFFDVLDQKKPFLLSNLGQTLQYAVKIKGDTAQDDEQLKKQLKKVGGLIEKYRAKGSNGFNQNSSRSHLFILLRCGNRSIWFFDMAGREDPSKLRGQVAVQSTSIMKNNQGLRLMLLAAKSGEKNGFETNYPIFKFWKLAIRPESKIIITAQISLKSSNLQASKETVSNVLALNAIDEESGEKKMPEEKNEKKDEKMGPKSKNHSMSAPKILTDNKRPIKDSSRSTWMMNNLH